MIMAVCRHVFVLAIFCLGLTSATQAVDKPLHAEGRIYGGPLENDYNSYPSLASENALPVESANDPWASPLPDSIRNADAWGASAPSAVQASPANKYNLKVSCGLDEMKVHVEFEKPFQGVIYSKGYFNKRECVYVTGNKHQTVFNFSIGYDKCGSFTRDAQAPLSAFPAKTQTESTTLSPPTTTSAAPAEETYEQWLARKYASLPTTTLALETTQQPLASAVPFTSSPFAAQGGYPVGMQQYPAAQNVQPVYSNPTNGIPAAQVGGAGYASPYGNQMMQPGFGSSFGPGYGTGVSVPQSLLPTSLTNYGSAPLQQRGYPLQTMPQQYQAGYPNQAYPYNNMGYGRMGRSLDADVSVTDIQWVENTIIIQQDKDVQDALDDAKSLQCEWKKRYSNDKNVNNGFRVDVADVVRASFPGDSVGAYMQVRSGLGPLAPEAKGVVKIGSPLTLVIALTDSENKFDLFVHSCNAKGSGRAPPIPLVDANGCIVRDKYMGPFIPFFNGNSTFGANRVSFSYFQAFKFPDSTDVNIDCAVTICRNSCPRQCFEKYTADAETLVKEWNKTEAARSLTPEMIVRPKTANAPRDQRMIMDLLEKKMAQANGPQRFDVKVQAKAPGGVNGRTRFLQLRELDNDTVPTLFTSTMSPLNSTLSSEDRRPKREADESSDVGLQKKITVIYPKDIEGMDDNHLLPKFGIQPRLTTKTVLSTPPSVVTSTFSTTVQSTLPSSTTKSATSAPSLMTTLFGQSTTSTTNSTSAPFLVTTLFSTVDAEKITPTPAFYVLRDEMQHVCVPMMGMIVGGGGCLLILFLAVLSSFCVCCRMRSREKKLKQSYPMYSEPRSVAIKAFPNISCRNKRTLL